MQWLQSGISLENLEFLNLNACQKISDKGIEAVTSLCPNLQRLAIYWIVGYISYWMFTLVNMNLFLIVGHFAALDWQT